MNDHAIPVIDSVDVVIVEGTVAACAAAYNLARRGVSVALVCSGSSPGYEIASCLRPFCHGDEIDAMPSAFARIFDAALTREAFETSFLHVGTVTDGLEDLLLDHRVRLYYTAYPAAVLSKTDRIGGVAFGGKFGLQAISAPVVVDATPTASVAQMAGAKLQLRRSDGKVKVGYSMLCKEDLPALEHYPLAAEVVPEAEVMTRGYYAELIRELDIDLTDPLSWSRIATELRGNLVSIGDWERETLPELDIVRGADSFLPGPVWRLASAASAQKARAGTTDADDKAGATVSDWRYFASEDVPNLYVLSQCADLDDRVAARMHTQYHAAIFQGAELARNLTTGTARVDPSDTLTARTATEGGSAASGSLSVTDPGITENGCGSLTIALPTFPSVADAQILVVGAGSSGAPAAVTAAGEGASVLCIDKHGDAGGTGTIGGVTTPWYGHRPPFFREVQKRWRATKRRASVPQALALSAWMRESGVTLLSGLPVAGVYRDQNRITAVLALTPGGPVAIAASTVIDATGDGDLAAWAGAPYTYGSERDQLTQWYSFGKFTDKRPSVSRKYRSIVDVRSLRDITRGIVIGRRQEGMFGPAEFPQHYLTPRESRHISARDRIGYLDGLAERRHPETVSIHYSNFDIKGLASSDYVMAGFIDQERYRCYRAYVPYGAMVPKTLENVLVTGKAYDASHDMLGLARQIADVMCQGAAAGLAAALAERDSTTVSEVDVPRLQEKLIAAGLMAEPDRTPDVSNATESFASFVATGDFKHLGRLACAQDCAVTTITDRVCQTTGVTRRNLGRLLCVLGDASEADYLLQYLEAALAEDPLPDGGHLLTNTPNHGYEPEPAHTIKALAMVRDERLVQLLQPLPARMHFPSDEPDAHFCYVHAMAYAAERMPLPGFVPMLNELLDHPDLTGRMLPLGDDPRLTVDWVGDRYAYLELCVARSLARCAQPRGFEVLINFLDDLRLFIAGSALDELRELSGEDHGYDRGAWSRWLSANEGSLKSVALERRFD